MCSQHRDLQSLGVLELIDEQEDRSIKLDNWPCLCHVKGSPGQEPVRNCHRKEQRLGRGDCWPKGWIGGKYTQPTLPLHCRVLSLFILGF